jgi:hypothetical protein
VAVTIVLYGKTPINIMGGETAAETKKIDWSSDTIKAALFTSAYTPAQDTDELYSGISANEVANGNGYTTGGNTCTSIDPAYTAGTNTGKFDAADPTVWTASGAGFSFRYVVIYDATSDVLIGYLDYGSTVTMSGANADTFTLTFDAAGVFTTTVP